jgi:ABC-type transporter Mla maintaining outer membrane lipid asymmetry ATPase subunit MlaF
MLTKEEFEGLITSIKDKMDETTQALISDDLVGVLSSYSNALDEIASLGEKIVGLETDKEELLKVNGRLFQKVGFDKEEEVVENVEDNEEKLEIEDVIDEKGDLI